MSNKEAITNLVGLMTSFHLEIKALPDDLKCAKCKSVLKNAYQMPCGCRFCRTCIDQFCPGESHECDGTPLSTAAPDYRANKSVLKLTAKCPHTGCPRQCSLANMESHMRVCPRKNIDCPFRELGCAQGMLPDDEMSDHLLQESRSHSEILIGKVANMSRDMEMLKRELLLKDEQGRHVENEMKLIIDENKSIKDENKSIKDEIKSIKREKEVLCDRVQQLSQKLELDSAMVTAVTAAFKSNRDEMEPVRGDIRSIRNQFECMKRRVESIQLAVVLGQLDDWFIEEDVAKTEWGWGSACKISDKFGAGGGHSLAFELVSDNSVSRGDLRIYLRIWAGPGDPLLDWPFRGEVTIIVAHRDRREACNRRTLQCEIERPANNQYSLSNPFKFWHAALREARLDLRQGVRVSCRIVYGAGQ